IFEQIPIGDGRISIAGNVVTINPTGTLAKGTGYYVEIDGTAFDDDAGNSYAGIFNNTTLNFTTVDVVINEVVNDARQDWSSSSFSSAPGGSPGSDDEWVELYIKTSGLDLTTGWTIEISSPSFSGSLNAGGAFQVIQYTGTGFPSNTGVGAYLVLGNPQGSSYINNSTTITLKDPSATVVDAVSLSSGSSTIYNESHQRFSNGLDTDAAGDWTQGQASIGAANTGPSVTLTVNNATIAEAAGTSTITTTLSAASSQNTTVNIGANASSTATGGADYGFSSTSISILAGNTSGTATVTAVQDPTDEENETVIIDITSVTNGTEAGTQQQTVTINDDDDPPLVTLSVSPATIAENDVPESSTITATLSIASEKTVTVTISSTSLNAVEGTDYTLSSTTITILPGVLLGTATLSSIQDADVEGHQTIDVDITGVTNGTEDGVQRQTITLLDDDLPKVTLSQSVTSFGEEGGTNTITATLDNTFTEEAVITIGVNSSSTADEGVDFTLSPTNITIPAGQKTGTATITSLSDLLDENDETVVIDILSADNAIENVPQQVTSTITDNDPTPTVAFNSTAS
ncbi:MAG TPA: Calx-beta domain-containing protein, partial [Prolixibacteraceae bacterium]|nr:Calx-beta domain-containing protein [Prolixibacteraceae bacterium]